ncbi:MAG: hypothetical protein P1S46_02470 [bacterium]|nr:hypothetical protein [bacterium]MDT8394837.1 hypothetical protein [bacterium]
MPGRDNHKSLKKLAKAEAKAAKKGSVTAGVTAPSSVQPVPVPAGGKTPAERSAEAAEKQLQLHRWKVIFGALSVLIALVSLITLLLKG